MFYYSTELEVDTSANMFQSTPGFGTVANEEETEDERATNMMQFQRTQHFMGVVLLLLPHGAGWHMCFSAFLRAASGQQCR